MLVSLLSTCSTIEVGLFRSKNKEVCINRFCCPLILFFFMSTQLKLGPLTTGSRDGELVLAETGVGGPLGDVECLPDYNLF